MSDPEFKEKMAFIVKTDGLLKHYIDSVILKEIKAGMTDEAFREMNVNHLHAATLLKNIAPCSLKKFAATLHLSKAAASALADRMVRGGVIERRPNPLNRREVLLDVSPGFERHVTHVRTELGRWFESLTEEMGMDAFEKWYEVMVAMNQILEKEIQKSAL